MHKYRYFPLKSIRSHKSLKRIGSDERTVALSLISTLFTRVTRLFRMTKIVLDGAVTQMTSKRRDFL